MNITNITTETVSVCIKVSADLNALKDKNQWNGKH